MSQSRAMQRLCGLMRKAVQDYEMIAPGDKVMVGVSGGKDSVALTIGLAELRRYIGFDFTVQAVTLDPQFGGKPMDYTVLQDLFARHGIPYEIRRTEIGPVVFDYRKEKNPCALCAKLRRGALHTAAQELGCNKVALGHHLDDAVETFYMNLWREGRIGCFSPVTYLSRRELTLIRPMLLATEQEVIGAVHAEGLPIVKASAPLTASPCANRPKNLSGSAAAPTTPSGRRPCTRCRRAASTAGGPSTPGAAAFPLQTRKNESCRHILLKNMSGPRSTSTPFAIISGRSKPVPVPCRCAQWSRPTATATVPCSAPGSLPRKARPGWP